MFDSKGGIHIGIEVFKNIAIQLEQLHSIIQHFQLYMQIPQIVTALNDLSSMPLLYLKLYYNEIIRETKKSILAR